MKRRVFVLVALILSIRLSAQTDTTGKFLDEAVITASKFEQKQSQTGKVVIVITKEQLEKSSGKTIAQVLNEQAGIVVNGALNAPGTVQTIFMRGAASGRTLLLLDGIPVNDPSMINNEFDLNLISIHDVERIEISKGAQSTLYGSDAIAGAINIITVKKDLTKPFHAKITGVFGNRSTFRGHIGVYGKVKKLTYTGRLTKLRTEGFSAAHDTSGTQGYDNDGLDGDMRQASLQYQLSPAIIIKSFVQHSEYHADIDAGVFSDETDYMNSNRNLNAGGGIFYKKGNIQLTANYQYGRFARKYVNDSGFILPSGTKFEKNQFGSRSHFGEFYGNLKATNWLTLLAGADYRRAVMHQQYFALTSFGPFSSSFDDTSLHQYSGYASIILHMLKNKLNIEGGFRYNEHSRYGTNTSFTFNPSFNITSKWRIFGSFASAFKSPTVYQIFDGFSGNPDLKPEDSRNYEAGLQFLSDKISTRAVYFHRNIENGIDFNYTTFKYFNFVKQIVDGVELELNFKPAKGFDISSNYAYINGEEQTQSRKSFNDTVYTYLLRRPKHSANLTLGYSVSKNFFVSLSGRYVGERYDAGGFMNDDVLLSSYFLLNGYAEFRIKPLIKLFIDLQNITGEKFFDVRGYNSIPFTVSGGINVQL